MWRLILVVWLAIFGGGQAADKPAPTPPAPAEVRIMTWNLKWFPGGKPAASIEQQNAQIKEVAAVLRETKPDILFLQEVKSEAAVVEVLAEAGLQHTVHVTSRFKDGGGLIGGQQLSISSRFLAVEAWQEPWKSGWANAPRGLVYARLRIPGMKNDVHAYGLHLKSNLGADPYLNTAKREDASEQLLAHIETQIRESGSEAVVVAGDFNTSFEQTAVPSEKTLKSFLAAGFHWAFEGVPLEDRITIPGGGRYPDACFDHFFLKGLGKPNAWVPQGILGSDHFPVVVGLVNTDRGTQLKPVGLR
jgi:endonuclease/exonuclease/phosphatase family metal-dependent hydrolase